MKILFRLPIYALGAAVLFLGAWQVARGCGLALPDLGLADLRSLLAENRRREALMTRYEALLESSQGKRCVVLEVIDKGMTLRQATAQFRLLNESSGETTACVQLMTGSPTEDEALARSVLAWVRAELRERPAEQRDAVLGRLEAEFNEAFSPSHLDGGEIVAE
jgi:hypothetical protein